MVMKTLNEYVKQASNVHPIKLDEYLSTKVQLRDKILDDVNPDEWKWYSSYSDKKYQANAKTTVKEFLYSDIGDKLYPNVNKSDRIVELFKDTYRAYIGTESTKSEEELDKMYDTEMRRVNSMIRTLGWAQYEHECLEQGWWAFMYWVIEKKYKQ